MANLQAIKGYRYAGQISQIMSRWRQKEIIRLVSFPCVENTDIRSMTYTFLPVTLTYGRIYVIIRHLYGDYGVAPANDLARPHSTFNSVKDAKIRDGTT